MKAQNLIHKLSKRVPDHLPMDEGSRASASELNTMYGSIANAEEWRACAESGLARTGHGNGLLSHPAL
jgi:hypothetical protein